MKSIGLTVSARTLSHRLPGKVFLPLANVPSIIYLLNRISLNSKYDLVLATTNLASDDFLVKTVESHGFRVFRGSGKNVLNRILAVSKENNWQYVVRITGDCPLVSSEFVEECLKQVANLEDWDLVTTKKSMPQGIDLEIIKVSTLEKISSICSDSDNEHVTSYFYNNESNFKIKFLANTYSNNMKEVFTLDVLEDFIFLATLTSMADPLASVRDLLFLAESIRIEL